MNNGNQRYYAGIGSRETPPEILQLMTKIAEHMRGRGYILRSGGADGADTAFEDGAGDSKEIFYAQDANGDDNAYALLDKVCLSLDNAPDDSSRMRRYVRNLLARNMYQILGKSLDTPVDCVICWTPGAQLLGGTRYAIRLAQLKEIDVYNLADSDTVQRITQRMEE